MSILVFASCKPRKPMGIMSESKLEEVLYDYHLAQALAESDGGDDLEGRRYKAVQSVFRKHGITEEEFDKTMSWYAVNTNYLLRIYNHLHGRFEVESKALGVGVTDTEMFASLSATGDTANIWTGSQILFLEANPLANVSTITLNADTSFHAGDTYRLNFSPHFITNERREAFAFMSVQYKDGSQKTAMQRVNAEYDMKLDIPFDSDKPDLQTSRITITFFYPYSENRQTTSYFFITNPSLLRFHRKVEDSKAEEVTDSIQTDSLGVDAETDGNAGMSGSNGAVVSNGVVVSNGAVVSNSATGINATGAKDKVSGNADSSNATRVSPHELLESKSVKSENKIVKERSLINKVRKFPVRVNTK